MIGPMPGRAAAANKKSAWQRPPAGRPARLPAILAGDRTRSIDIDGAGELLLEMLPVAVESVGVSRRRLRRLRFEPANRTARSIVEGVDAANAGPEQVPA